MGMGDGMGTMMGMGGGVYGVLRLRLDDNRNVIKGAVGSMQTKRGSTVSEFLQKKL